MGTITPHQPGQASGVAREDFTQFSFLLSDVPAIFVEEFTVTAAANAASVATFKRGSVVKLTAAGLIDGLADNVSASDQDGAKGIVAGEYVTKVTGTTVKAKLYRGGHFNGDSLIWDATTFNNDAKKIAAFRDAPGPVQIVIGFNSYHRPST